MKHYTLRLLTAMLCLQHSAGAQSDNEHAGRYPRAYREHQEADATTKDVSYNAQGTLLAVASYEEVGDERHGDIVVYDVSADQPRYRFDATAAFCSAISPDGSKLAAWVLGEGFIIRDMPDTSKHRAVLEDKQANLVFKCAFSPDGKSLALAGLGGKVRIMDVASGRIIKELAANDHNALTIKVTYTRDGKLVAAGGDDVIRVWDAKTWKVLRDILPPDGEHQLVSAVSEGSSRVVCAYHNNTYVFDLNTGRQIYKRDVGQFYNAAYSSAGNLILLSSREGVFAFHKDLTSTEMNGQAMPDIEWLAIDPKEQKAAFATERQLITTDYGTLVKLSGPLSSAAENLMAAAAPKQKEMPAPKTKIVMATKAPAIKAAAPFSKDKCISGNCKTGFGRMRYADSSVYEGAWANGLRNGRGTLTEKWRVCAGEWHDGNPPDSGVLLVKRFNEGGKLNGGSAYIGTIKNGLLNGPGMMIEYTARDERLDTMIVWKGTFTDSHLRGSGTEYFPGTGTYTSNSWTDNFSFTSGSIYYIISKVTETGQLQDGAFKNDRQQAPSATTSSSPSSAQPQPAGGGMLDYGIFNYRQQKLPASYSTDHK